MMPGWVAGTAAEPIGVDAWARGPGYAAPAFAMARAAARLWYAAAVLPFAAAAWRFAAAGRSCAAGAPLGSAVRALAVPGSAALVWAAAPPGSAARELAAPDGSAVDGLPVVAAGAAERHSSERMRAARRKASGFLLHA